MEDSTSGRPFEITVKLNPATTMLLILDMQNCFANDEGSFARHGRDISLIKRAIPTTKEAAAYCRKKGIPILYTKQVNIPEFLAGGLQVCMGREVSEWIPAKTYPCMKGTWDAEIIEELSPLDSDIVIEKNKSSAFYNTWVELWLRSKKTKTILIAGCTTGMCVAHTVMEASARGYETIVIEDGVGDQDPFIHSSTLELLDRRFGRIIQWETVRSILESYPGEKKIPHHPVTPNFKILPNEEKTYLRQVR